MLGSFHFYGSLNGYSVLGVVLLPTMLGSFHFYLQYVFKVYLYSWRYYPLCWVLFISTVMYRLSIGQLACYYPLCWVLFISTIVERASNGGKKSLLPTMLGSFHFYQMRIRMRPPLITRYYPLCWVLFISTVPLQKPSKIKAFQGHFCKYLSEYSEKRVFQPLFCACQNFTPDSSYPSIYF